MKTIRLITKLSASLFGILICSTIALGADDTGTLAAPSTDETLQTEAVNGDDSQPGSGQPAGEDHGMSADPNLQDQESPFAGIGDE